MAFLDLWRGHPGNNGLPLGWCPEPEGGLRGVQSAAAVRTALACVADLAPIGPEGESAAALAAQLESAVIPGFGPRRVVRAPDVSAFLQAVFGQTGVIYARAAGARQCPDHIDVWNGYRSATRGLAQWTGALEQAGQQGCGPSEIWFWPLA